MTKKAKTILISVISVLVIALSFFSGYLTRELVMDEDARSAMYLIENYKKHYYFEEDNIVDVISSTVLDKYSTYYSREEYELVQRSAKGYTDGIGLVFKEKSSVIEEVLGNSPSQLAGITAGGEVVAYNVGKGFISPINYTDTLNAVRLLKSGERITLKILYGSVEKVFDLTKREYLRTYVKYKSNSGTYAYQGDNDIKRVKITEASPTFSQKTAYIKYSSFNGKNNGLYGSAGQIENALEFFKQEGKENLIFDLRGNGGGYLDIMNKVASYIVPSKNGQEQLTLYSKDKHGVVTKYYSEKSRFEDFGIKKLIVMLDENSASASEALTGAMHDYAIEYGLDFKIVISSSNKDNQTVYKSYGKGIMQTTYKNPDGSAVKLTSAKLFWPKTNICIHNVGITSQISDIIVNAEKQSALNYAISLC